MKAEIQSDSQGKCLRVISTTMVQVLVIVVGYWEIRTDVVIALKRGSCHLLCLTP